MPEVVQTMHISDLLRPADVISHLSAANKRELLKTLAEHAAAALKLDTQSILAALAAREVMGSTGVGKGVAIPHARIEDLDSFYALFARLDSPLEFNAVDDEPVDLVFLLLTPGRAKSSDHMRALAAVTRRLRNSKLADDLRSTDERSLIYQLLVGSA
jgi:PTS system nitrogen regulatory IIA component